MTTELERQDFGMTDKGAVTLIKLNNSGDAGENNFSYMVRHGVRTVGIYPSRAKGEAVARALVA